MSLTSFQSFYVDLTLTSVKAMFTLGIFILGYVYSMIRGKFWRLVGKKSPEKVWKKIERY